MLTLKETARLAKLLLVGSLAGQGGVIATWHHVWPPAAFAAGMGALGALLALSVGERD